MSLRDLRSFVLPLLLFGAVLPARAEGLAVAGKLTYGTAATFAPFEFVQNGTLTGFDIDLAQAVAGKMGVQADAVNMEFGGLIPALQGGRIDLINSAMYLSPEREQAVEFVPYMTIDNMVLVRAEGASAITGYDLSLCGKRIAVTLGGIEERDAHVADRTCRDAGRPPLTVLAYPTAQDTALNLLQGRADGAFTSRFGAAVLEAQVPGGYRVVGTPFGENARIGFAIRKGDGELHARLQQALDRLHGDGTFDRLLRKWHLEADRLPGGTGEAARVVHPVWDGLAYIGDFVVSAPFLRGAGMTMLLTVASLVLGSFVGVLAALGQLGRAGRFLRGPIFLYLWLFRGTPVLLQIVFVYNVLPLLGVRLPALTSAIVALSLNEGAYMAEIVRSGLDAVRPGQRLAALALGMSPVSVFRHVVAPQAFRVVLPMLGNQVIGMLKTSSLVSVIAVQVLLLVADQAASANFRYLEALSAAALYYLAFTTLFMLLQYRLERYVSPRRRSDNGRGWLRHLLPAGGDVR